MMRIICFDFMGADDITRVWARSFVKSPRQRRSGQLQNLWERGDEKPPVYRANPPMDFLPLTTFSPKERKIDDGTPFFEQHNTYYITMCDFQNFGLIFAGQMHCLPQRIKYEIFSNGTLSVEKISNHVDFSL